ncbi:hypothetical protein PoB_001653200 [Plakobranchus ocellatus]|uniref:Uncharacterized protein n=1 Tax=Plakobranchus ocellatus TaxID=259542 RepID=A0AAV3Z674_9GAST|nr:hypothetical protein PoB_001653200 [Plakobranchus ocellatus]
MAEGWTDGSRETFSQNSHILFDNSKQCVDADSNFLDSGSSSIQQNGFVDIDAGNNQCSQTGESHVTCSQSGSFQKSDIAHGAYESGSNNLPDAVEITDHEEGGDLQNTQNDG